MKYLKHFTLIFIIITSFSCKNENTSKKQENIEVVKTKTPNYKKAEFHIKGMTCEIGCARLIQSKLSKTTGVKSVDISFKDSIGRIEFDKNKINQKGIKQVIEEIAGGDLYKMSDIKNVNEFTIKK